MNNIFFTADTHFGHKNIIKFCDRPYKDVLEMNEALITNWNEKVGLNDTVYHLGDVVFRDPEIILPRLNGKIHLIRGNHDKQPTKYIKLGFYDFVDYKELKIDGLIFVLMHYPLETWNKRMYGAIHLHGHCHGTLKNIIQNRYDVGVDTNNYEPIAVEEVLEKVLKQNLDNKLQF